MLLRNQFGVNSSYMLIELIKYLTNIHDVVHLHLGSLGSTHVDKHISHVHYVFLRSSCM